MPFNCVLGRFLTSNKHTDEKHVPSKAGLKCQDIVRRRNKAVYSKRNSYFILMVNYILFYRKLWLSNTVEIDFLFLSAQMTIFALLFKFWPKFCEFRSRLPSDKILLALERKKGKRMQTKEGKISEERLTKFQVRADGLNKICFKGKRIGIQISVSQPEPKLLKPFC